MTTATATLTVTNLVDATWTTDAGRSFFEAKTPAYGIVNERGEALSFNGTSPSVWDRKRIAQTIADTVVLDGSLTWVEVA